MFNLNLKKSKALNYKQTQSSKIKTFGFLALDLFRVSSLVFSILLFGCQNKQLYKDSRIMMGTFVEVTSPYKEAAGIVFGEIERIENLLSKYNKSSEISKLNKQGNLKVSPETFYILKKAKEFWSASDGAFDITIGPLMDLWGFTDKNYRLPKEEEIKKTLEFVGMDKIIFNERDSVVKFRRFGIKVDLGAIAKGYALDCAINKLKQKGVKSCLINAGGQIYCLGTKFGKPWRIAIQDPRNPNRISGYLDLENNSVATSGDYQQYFSKNKKHYSHIFNPKTGYPADSKVISVTVVAPDGLTADALSTTIFVMGKDKGLKFAKKFKSVEVKAIECIGEDN